MTVEPSEQANGEHPLLPPPPRSRELFADIELGDIELGDEQSAPAQPTTDQTTGAPSDDAAPSSEARAWLASGRTPSVRTGGTETPPSPPAPASTGVVAGAAAIKTASAFGLAFIAGAVLRRVRRRT